MKYMKYDSFVVLHGTDHFVVYLFSTQKPIIFTGSQLPIGES